MMTCAGALVAPWPRMCRS